MKEKLSLSVILPIKSSKSRDFNEYFEKAMNSIKTQTVDIEELIIIHTPEESLVEHLNGYDFESLNVTKLLRCLCCQSLKFPLRLTIRLKIDFPRKMIMI